MRKDNDTFNLPCNWTYRGPSSYSLLLGFGRLLLINTTRSLKYDRLRNIRTYFFSVISNSAILMNTTQGVLNMTYTIATRPTGSINQFTPVSGFVLMTLRQAQDLAQEYRASGIDAVAFNMAGV